MRAPNSRAVQALLCTDGSHTPSTGGSANMSRYYTAMLATAAALLAGCTSGGGDNSTANANAAPAGGASTSTTTPHAATRGVDTDHDAGRGPGAHDRQRWCGGCVGGNCRRGRADHRQDRHGADA